MTRDPPTLDPTFVIIDFHTHIFPPDVRGQREEYVRRDSTFAEMYGDPKAKIATAVDLVASMDAAGVDVSVALGFAWHSQEDIVAHNDYLLEVAAKSGGRIVAFATVNMADAGAPREVERCAKAGARGLGELRPENQGWDLGEAAGEALASIAQRLGLILSFHVTEPGDRSYPGRRGLELASFRAYTERHTELKIVGAHLGGGYYQERHLRAAPYVDTAAQPYLHPGERAVEALRRVPGHRILFGSDFPLISQARQLEGLRKSRARDCFDAALGDNAEELLA